MKRTLIILPLLLGTISLLAIELKPVTPAADIPARYAQLDKKSGADLYAEVEAEATLGYASLTYGELWEAYGYTDVYPADSVDKAGLIWDMYSNCKFDFGGDQCGSYKKECDCYNREHSVPKSWFGGGTGEKTPGADIFHIVPTDGKVNGMRSNYSFGEVNTASYKYDGSQLGSPKEISIDHTMLNNGGAVSILIVAKDNKVFEPQDKYKGDFARGYFGTILRWGTTYSKPFTNGEGAEMFSGDYTAAGHWGLTEYGLALLMKWHRMDPVSQKEIDRNNGIQKTQGNRNPFIDYPYIAEYIWGERAGQPVDMSHMLASCSPAFIPGQSNGYIDTSTDIDNIEPQQPAARKFILNGQLFIEIDGRVYNIMGQEVSIE